MVLKKWEELPEELRLDEVKGYYDILSKKKTGLFFKRAFDIVVSLLMLIILLPLFLILAIAIKIDSPGPVFYRQERVTVYGKRFKIHKFRTMVNGADKKGSLVTVKNDARVTRVGALIRKCRLDEVSQLIDVFLGDMTFVGTRPEVLKYVDRYTPEMMATLLLPAGVTSRASIMFLDEEEMLACADDVDKEYLEKILPEKMVYNLEDIKKMSFFGEIKIMLMTVAAIFGKDYSFKKDK